MTHINTVNKNNLKQYDEWLKCFFDCYNKFEEYVELKRKKYNNTLNLSVTVFNNKEKPDYIDSNSKINGIRLFLGDCDNPILEGPSIILDKEEKEVFKYLLLNIFSFYINKNYSNNIPEKWDGILYEDIDLKKRQKEKTRKADSFAVTVLGLPINVAVGCYKAYFDARILYNDFQTELDTIVLRHNYGINSIDDICEQLANNIVNNTSPISIDLEQLDASRTKTETVMKLIKTK